MEPNLLNVLDDGSCIYDDFSIILEKSRYDFQKVQQVAQENGATQCNELNTSQYYIKFDTEKQVRRFHRRLPE